MRFTTSDKRLALRPPPKAPQAAASPDAGGSAATGSGGDAAFIQNPRSARRDHGLIPFARSCFAERCSSGRAERPDANLQGPPDRPAVSAQGQPPAPPTPPKVSARRPQASANQAPRLARQQFQGLDVPRPHRGEVAMVRGGEPRACAQGARSPVVMGARERKTSICGAEQPSVDSKARDLAGPNRNLILLGAGQIAPPTTPKVRQPGCSSARAERPADHAQSPPSPTNFSTHTTKGAQSE
jgi:hypothetical protein